jgi:hypothetical protein
MVMPVETGEPPMLLINMFMPTARSAVDEAMGLRPLGRLSDAAQEETTELIPGVSFTNKTIVKDYYKLPAPKDAGDYREAAGHLERYGEASAAFGTNDLACHHRYVNRICRYMTSFGVQAALDFDLSFRRKHHARALPNGFADPAAESLMFHLHERSAASTPRAPTAPNDRKPLSVAPSDVRKRIYEKIKKIEIKDTSGRSRQVCGIWNLADGGCNDVACPNNFMHRCCICRTNDATHHAVDCRHGGPLGSVDAAMRD